MVALKGEQVFLRALEPEDLDFVYGIENDADFWELSDTQTPYSRHILKAYLDNAKQDIYEAKQLRLVICTIENGPVGLIDLFDFDPKNKRAGIGILIKNTFDRSKGYGNESLELLINYAFKGLHLHQLYANVSEHNVSSLKLFKKQGFKIVGLKKDWRFNGEKFSNEYLLQLIKN